jgi:TPR repeat protein
MTRIVEPDSRFREAARACARQDFAYATQIYEQLAKSGHSYALVQLAQMHAEGKGTPVDIGRAQELLDRAEKLGETEALIQKGRIWLTRNDTKRYFASVQYAAGKGFLPSQYQLAVCYLLGVGTEKDERKGLETMREAADAGHLQAKSYLAKKLMARPWDPIGFVSGVAIFLGVVAKGLLLHMTNPGDPRIR